MWYELRTGTDLELKDHLNGVLVLGPFSAQGIALGGRTLIFTDPAAEVTFPGANGELLRIPAVVQAIKEEVADLDIKIRPAGALFTLGLYREGGFTIGDAGTANAALRLSTASPTAAPAAMAASDFVAFSQGNVAGKYALLRTRS